MYMHVYTNNHDCPQVDLRKGDQNVSMNTLAALEPRREYAIQVFIHSLISYFSPFNEIYN